MKNENISGIGSIYGGEIDCIDVEGIAKLKGTVTANKVYIEGLFKTKAKLTTDELNVEGVVRAFRDIKAKNVMVEGILKLRRAKLTAEYINCDGIIVSNKEVNADQIYIDGVCSIARLYGDNVTIKNKENGLQESKIPIKLMPFVKMYFGRKLSLSYSLVDVVECTSLTASGLKSKIIKANSVKLTNNCIIEKLYCDGEISIDSSCKVGEIIGKNNIIKDERMSNEMANVTLMKILDMYKNGKINPDEAEKMIGSIYVETSNSNTPDVPWADDGKLRIVAFIGRKLLKKGDTDAKNIEVCYTGGALNVESFGNLTCKDISLNASAGGNINASDIGVNVSCGGNITCKNIGGNVSAGGGVHIQK